MGSQLSCVSVRAAGTLQDPNLHIAAMQAALLAIICGSAAAFSEVDTASAAGFQKEDITSAEAADRALSQKFEANVRATEQLHKEFEELEKSVKNHKPPASLDNMHLGHL